MRNFLSILAGVLMLAAALTPGAAAPPQNPQPGSTVMGCLKETGMGGYVLTDGTVDGVMISGNGNLKAKVGNWVKIDGESFYAGGIEHFRAKTVTSMADTCESGHVKPYSTEAGAELKNADGKVVARAQLKQAEHGVLIKIEFDGLPAGRHALHLHEKGSCQAPDFESAGGHFNPADVSHGYLAEKSHHAGDMPNFDVPESGKTTVEVLNPVVTLSEGRKNSLLGNGGTSLVVHSGIDDYESQPSGGAGARIACGVVKPTSDGEPERTASSAK